MFFCFCITSTHSPGTLWSSAWALAGRRRAAAGVRPPADSAPGWTRGSALRPGLARRAWPQTCSGNSGSRAGASRHNWRKRRAPLRQGLRHIWERQSSMCCYVLHTVASLCLLGHYLSSSGQRHPAWNEWISSRLEKTTSALCLVSVRLDTSSLSR